MPVRFDEEAAEQFRRAALQTASELHSQGGSRRAAAEQAISGCVGPVARLLERACTLEAEDRGTLAGVLSKLAEQVAETGRVAREENTRERLAAEWEARQALRVHDAATPVSALLHASGIAHPSALAGDPRPQQADGISPVLAASFSPRRRVRTPHRTAEGGSGAHPDSLRRFAARSRTNSAALERELSTLWSAWTQLLASSPWLRVDSATFLTGFQGYLAENEADAQWIGRVSDAFRAAGGGTLRPSVLRGLATVRPRIRSDSELLTTLATASDAELAAILAGIPGIGAQLQQLNSRAVADWWTQMAARAEPGSTGHTARQERLLRSLPDVLGNLDGMPVAARVRANTLRIPALLRAVRAELRGVERGEIAGGTGRAGQLRSELSYLRRVGQGEAQLYLYDRHASRIVEVLGAPGPGTQRAITYVPGTYTGMNSFYTGRVQQLGHALTQGTPGTIVFVYKDGPFPGEEPSGRGPRALRIREANNAETALTAGEQLRRFGTGVRSDPSFATLPQIGIGHSWGLANLTASEVAGARYDTVISLSGAGMPAEWSASPTTGYFDLSYPDILQGAQQQGYVWKGHTPRNNPGFAKFPLYSGPDDAVLSSSALTDTPEKLRVLTRNHDLIASTDLKNTRVLEDLERLILQ